MVRTPNRRFVAAVIVALCLSGCGRDPSTTASPQQRDAYESRDPGSDATPTNDESFQLLAADGPTRFAAFQALIVNAGKSCGSVTRAVLTGGLDGTDEWRVDCGGGGKWQIWFKPDEQPDIDRCDNANCA